MSYLIVALFCGTFLFYNDFVGLTILFWFSLAFWLYMPRVDYAAVQTKVCLNEEIKTYVISRAIISRHFRPAS